MLAGKSQAVAFARDGVIEAVGAGDELPMTPTSFWTWGHVVIPGMVNTHHHLFQNLTRAVPAAQNAPLFGWLQTLYPIWSHISPDHIYWSTALGLAELALSGCTTSSDHLYLYPNGARLDDALGAAADVGVRSRHPWVDEHWRELGRPAADQLCARSRHSS